MKNIFSFLTFTTLFVLLILSASAQQSQKPVPANATSHEKGILTKYDAAKNETSVYVYPYLKIYESERNNILTAETLTMTVGFNYAGQNVVSKPRLVELGFISTVKSNWRFADEHERKLMVIADNQRFDLDVLNRIKTRTVPVINQQDLRYIENLATVIPFETFQKFAQAKKVDFKIGSYEIRLRKDVAEILRELLSRTNI